MVLGHVASEYIAVVHVLGVWAVVVVAADVGEEVAVAVALPLLYHH